MRTVLALLGCAGRVEVALATRNLAAPSLVALASPEPRANLLLKAVHGVLQAADLSPRELDLIVAATGPGSFTGIRNTLACAWGLSQAHGVPVCGFSSLLVQAARALERQVLAVQPARRSLAYAQAFRRGRTWEPAGPVDVVPLDDVARQSLPVAAPPGLALPPGTPVATLVTAPAEALLALGLAVEEPDPESLTPQYLEPFPATEVR